MYFVHFIWCVCICFLSLPLFTLFAVFLLFSSFTGRLSAGWFLFVSWALLKVSSC